MMKKPLECHGSPGLYTPQGPENDYKEFYWPNDQVTNVH